MIPPVLEEGPYTLRLPVVEDVSWIFHACQDEAIQRFTLVPTPYLPSHAVGFVEVAATACTEGTALHFVVARTESGELLGAASLGLGVGRPGEGVGELGYWVDRDARRQGVGRAAVAALERLAVELGLRELLVPILTDNTASRGLVEACGYTWLGDGPELAPGRPSVRYVKVLAAD
jgi:RimJ/RimL family protein N-acetyltransferase